MDNVVQNINLEDIIPSNLQNYDSKKLFELANSIKEYGIIEPLLVRPKNGKYEIIIGNKRYQAAKMVGLDTVPALIKNVDDEIFKQYLKINNSKNNQTSNNKFINLNSIPSNEVKQNQQKISIEKVNSPNLSSEEKETIQENSNFRMNYTNNRPTDIINLSELNKEEYERKDLNMNNEQMNNNVMNNMGVSSGNSMPSMQEPTFGGRFFPSLEDEPTNMNMGVTAANSMPSMNPQSNNNLIDLTDMGIEKENNMMPNQNVGISQSTSNFTSNIPEYNSPPMMNASANMEPSPEMPSPIPDPMSNIINIGDLQSNNPTIQPEPMGMENQMPGNIIPSSNLTMEQSQNIPQFDMSQNIAPTEFIQNQPLNMPQNNFNTKPTTDFVGNETIQTPYVEPAISQPMMDPTIGAYNPGIEMQNNSMPKIETIVTSTKDITPVINTIKSLIANLETFGYKLNINEEELPTSVKLTIEVEK